MIIRGWSIDGFGLFCGEACRGLGDGLTLIIGPNESGKSTLLDFIRGALFGFPDRRSRSPLHLPLRGGRHGGRLMLETDEGPVVIDREAGRWHAAELTLPDGGRGGEAELGELLGGIDLTVFRSVFGFGLAELSDFALLDGRGIDRRLSSAGITGAGRSAREAIEALDEEAAKLLRPRGRSAVGAAVSELSRIEKRITAARGDLERHPELVAEEEDRQRDLESLSAEADRLRVEERRRERLLELWPAWHQRGQALQRLAGLTESGATAAAIDGEDRPPAGPDGFPATAATPLLLTGAAAAAAGAVWRFSLQDPLAGGLLAAAALAAALVSAWFGWKRRRDLAELRRFLTAAAERRSLEETVRQVDSLVAARIGNDQQARRFIAELDRGAVAAWEARLSELREAQARTAERRDTSIRRLEAARRERQSLEQSADLPGLETERQALLGRLTEEAEAWRVNRLARGLVDRTLHAFTGERQPRVLQRASRLFSGVTEGHYEQVARQTEGSGLTLLAADGRRIDAGDLSRGAAEQLYLCLRLALAAEHNSRGCPMPLLMDDVLVNADPRRAAGLARAITDYAGTAGQVILFTCHPATADFFGDVLEGSAIRRLAVPQTGADHSLSM